MIGMGDEVRRSQFGNNNAYCQDNEASWVGLGAVGQTFRRSSVRAVADRAAPFARSGTGEASLEFESTPRPCSQDLARLKLGQPDWSPSSHSIALTAHMANENQYHHLIFNAFWEPLEFELPIGYCGPWRRWVDTALDPPQDIVPWRTAPAISGSTYLAGLRSVVALYADVNE